MDTTVKIPVNRPTEQPIEPCESNGGVIFYGFLATVGGALVCILIAVLAFFVATTSGNLHVPGQ